LRGLPLNTDPNLLVGTNTADDAGVYRIAPDLALVQTVDFFTPILDDPYDFGQVAAANALSDVYAMGGEPLTALNILAFQPGMVEAEAVAEILRGGAEKAAEAGVVIVGGHSVQDAELKYGLSVTGRVHPDRIVRNVGARAGDRLVLTKPLGTGAITTGLKRGLVGDDVLRTVTAGMATLNRLASEAMLEVGVHAATDVTGFGLLGHLWEMVSGSGVSATVYAYNVPYYQGFTALAEQDVFPGGAYATRDYLKDHINVGDGVSETAVMSLCDPQTSGGLLIAVSAAKHDALLEALLKRERPCATVGEITGASGDSRITIAG
jgi:selenide,water dikinase